MNPPEDKALHDLFRDKIKDFQPEYEAEDWELMRKKLEVRRRFPIWFFVFGVAVFAGLFFTLNIYKSEKTNYSEVRIKDTSELKSYQSPKIKAISSHKKSEIRITKKENTELFERTRIKSVSENTKNQQPSIGLSEVKDNGTIFQSFPVQNTLINSLKPLQSPTVKNIAIDVSNLQNEIDIIQQMSTGRFGEDSTAYKVFDRNLNRWPKSVVVCDFTSSMYPFTTQLFAWFKKNDQNPNIKGMVLFTDCDSLGEATQKSKVVGKMFMVNTMNTETVIPVMIAASRNTIKNDDDPENGIEALLYAQKAFPDAENLIFIADNGSGIKGMNQIKELKKHIRVVVCGETGDTTTAIQPDFYRIAGRRGSSLHTIEDDLTNLDLIDKTTCIKVGKRYYKYKNGDFQITLFQKRPKRFLGLFWW